MLKRLIRLGLAFCLISIVAPAQAALIWQDEFDRPTNNSVGNGWSETEDDANDVAIVFDNYLLLRDNGPDGAASQLGISTVGYENISVEFRWRPWRAEANDRLQLSYRALPNLGWTLVFDSNLGGTETYRVQSVALGSAANDTALLDLAFRIDATYRNDAVKVDYVRVHGTAIDNDPISIGEPATLMLFAFGLASLASVARSSSPRIETGRLNL